MMVTWAQEASPCTAKGFVEDRATCPCAAKGFVALRRGSASCPLQLPPLAPSGHLPACSRAHGHAQPHTSPSPPSSPPSPLHFSPAPSAVAQSSRRCCHGSSTWHCCRRCCRSRSRSRPMHEILANDVRKVLKFTQFTLIQWYKLTHRSQLL